MSASDFDVMFFEGRCNKTEKMSRFFNRFLNKTHLSKCRRCLSSRLMKWNRKIITAIPEKLLGFHDFRDGDRHCFGMLIPRGYQERSENSLSNKRSIDVVANREPDHF